MFRIFLLLFLAGPLTAQSGFTDRRTDVASLGFSADRLTRLDSFLQALVDDGTLPNAVTFIARKGAIVHHKAFGFHELATRQPLREDAIFRIASQTKAIVTVGLMMLFEEGHFLLEDPIERYIPAFANTRVLVDHDPESLEYTTRPASRSITIRDLLTHTAGIPYGHPLDSLPEFQLPFFASLEADELEAVVNRIAARPLLHDPGEGFTYGLNTDVLGRLIEVLSGERLDRFLHRRIFRPLGMRDSHFYLPAEKHGRLVRLYSKHGRTAPLTLHDNETYQNFATSGAQTYFSGGAGSVGTIRDYAVFCQMLLNGGNFNGVTLLSPKTVAMMTRPQSNGQLVWNRQDPYGLGLQIISAQSRYGDQATPGSYTWGGMYLSEYTIDPQEELILLIYTNVHPIPQYGEVVRKFRILTYAALLNP